MDIYITNLEKAGYANKSNAQGEMTYQTARMGSYFKITEKQKNKSKVEMKNVFRIFVIVFLVIFQVTKINAQNGLFIKFSLGSGYTKEYSNINGSGLAIATKNHAIGWGITDKFALQIGEFGGLNKLAVGDYNYINLDVFGIGFSYQMPVDIKISILGGFSRVSFAKKWSEATGDNGGNGYGINLSIDKEWFIAKRWGIRVGPQLHWIKTIDTDNEFINVSVNGSVVFYLKPVSL